ncbi:MAG TPA: RcpC/CpaB family pilus assembly protein [Chloroflexota bacterium]|nr:RcpC/CpaB family pilus assembly protein [Chloroflexota bacterium]
MRFTAVGGLDLVTGVLMLSGVVLIAGSLVAATTLLTPVQSGAAAEAATRTPAPTLGTRPSVVLAADQVATVLFVDASTGAGSATRSGDRVDVLGYFSRQVIGSESETRLLLPDVPVLTVDHSGSGVALTLAVSHDGALLLQEALAIGARPFVTLRAMPAIPDAAGVPRSFSDSDLADRLAGLR